MPRGHLTDKQTKRKDQQDKDILHLFQLCVKRGKRKRKNDKVEDNWKWNWSETKAFCK